jgi:Domain of unknown function (DUF5666)
MTRYYRRTAFAFAMLVLCASLIASTHRAVAHPGNPVAEIADALGIGPMSGASVRGVVSAVQGTVITLNTGGAPAIMIETSAAKFMSDKSGPASIADVKPGVRITAFINTAPTLQPSSFLRAQLITIESLPDLEVTGTVDSIDLAHARFIVLGIAIGVDANTTFGSTFPTFAAIKGVADIAVGQVVTVTARFSNGAIVATGVQITSPTIQPSTILLGSVKSIGPVAWVITSHDGKDTTISVDSQTKIIGDPKVGDSVQVMANIDSAHNYLAIAIVKIDLHDNTTIELHGTVKSISAAQWVVGGPLGTLAPDFLVMIASTTVIYPDPKVGDRVVVVGTRDSTGTFTATKIGKDS